MKITVVGDSYSTQHTIINDKPTHFTWIHCLEEEYEVECLAVPGSSNVETLSQVPEDWDCLIASLSPLVRPPQIVFAQDRTNYHHQEKTRQHVKANISAAYKIIKLPRSIVWSSFSEYEGISRSIHYIPLIGHNELIDLQYGLRKQDYTGCHLTKQGNQMLAKIMKGLIVNVKSS